MQIRTFSGIFFLSIVLFFPNLPSMETFTLKTEFIALSQLLKTMGMVGTGGEAKMRIQAGEVLVNDQVETQVRKKLRAGDKVTIDGQMIEIA